MFVKMAPKSKKCANYASCLAGAKKTPNRRKFSQDHPPPRRRETYRQSIHMLNFTYEDDIKIKINMLREYLGFFIYPQKPAAGLPNLVRLSL
jgi:hypothetical protein